MGSPHSSNNLVDQLARSQLISNLTPINDIDKALKYREVVSAARGSLRIGTQIIDTIIGVREDFPHSLPVFFIVPNDILGFIPHVDHDGYVCYADREGVLLNRRDPYGILENSIQLATDTLLRGLKGENRWDFVNEFEAYWRNCLDIEHILSFLNPDQRIRKINLIELKQPGENKPINVLCDDIGEIQSYYHKSFPSATHVNALYIPLMENTYLEPPKFGQKWDLEKYIEVVQNYVSRENRRLLKKLTHKWKREELILFMLPRQIGGHALFGVRFTHVEKNHPLNKGGRIEKITPLVIGRLDSSYLLPRGGANNALHQKRVALIGCGSVGGFLALSLVRSGILNITLIDPDQFKPENSFRHVLGNKGGDKAETLKEEIEKTYPYVKVKSFMGKAENLLLNAIILPENFDAIIIAIGDETVSLQLNEFLHKENNPPVIYTWLEPYNIGGHVLISGNRDNKGCLECLFTLTKEANSTCEGNRAAFAQPGQVFTKDLLGCGSIYLPYGSFASEKTAQLATRLCVDTLLGKINGNPLVSWKGDAQEFLDMGFLLTNRYCSFSEEALYQNRYLYINPNCPVCGD